MPEDKRPGLVIKEVPWNSPEMKAHQGGWKRGEERLVESALFRKILQDKYVPNRELFERGFRTEQHDSRYLRDRLGLQININ